jgi:hypothetical protein
LPQISKALLPFLGLWLVSNVTLPRKWSICLFALTGGMMWLLLQGHFELNGNADRGGVMLESSRVADCLQLMITIMARRAVPGILHP